MNADQPDPYVAKPEGKCPNIADLAMFWQGPVDIRSVALSGLFLIALGFTLYAARPVLLPIILALLLSFLLTPLVKGLTHLGLPTPVSAAVVLLAILGLVGYGTSLLSAPALSWMQQLPQSLRQIEAKMQPVKQSVQDLRKATEQVEQLTQQGAKNARSAVEVEVKRVKLLGLMFNQTLGAVANVVVMVILLYFLLASGDLFLLKLVRVLPSLSDKKAAVSIVHQIERDVSRYLLTITMINIGLGVAVSGVMVWLEMPNPMLWGVMAGCLNFMPYLGALSSATVLTLVALLTFDEIGRALAIPAVFLMLTCLEGFIVTPTVVGRRLALNPVAIFIWLTFWGWLWGIAGALLAVPLLAMVKIVCDHVQPLATIGEFFGD